MTAQRLAHKNEHDKEKSGYFQFNNDPKQRVSEPVKMKKSKLDTAASAKKASPIDLVTEKKEAKSEKKSASKGGGGGSGAGGKNKEKQGQKGLLGIGKVVNWL